MFSLRKAAACLKISETPRLSITPPWAPRGFYYFVFPSKPPLLGVSLSPPPLIGLSCGCRHPCLTPSCLPTHRPNPPVKLIPNPLWQVEHPPPPPTTTTHTHNHHPSLLVPKWACNIITRLWTIHKVYKHMRGYKLNV